MPQLVAVAVEQALQEATLLEQPVELEGLDFPFWERHTLWEVAEEAQLCLLHLTVVQLILEMVVRGLTLLVKIMQGTVAQA
jgi:hypothetical protein